MSFLTPSAGSAQKQYLDLRRKALFANDPARTEKVKVAIQALQKKNGCGEDWLATYQRITRALQEAPLTINISGRSWFAQENHFTDYKQMYQRAVNDQGELKLRGNNQNPASLRAGVDDAVSLPESWRHKNPLSKEKRVYDVMNMSSAKVSQMRNGVTADGLTEPYRPKLVGDDVNGYGSKNKKFDPNAKQVFAALNYGRCPNGATQEYGWSQLVLRPALKRDAIYFMGDTFYNYFNGTAQQATFQTLGALVAETIRDEVRQAIWDSCFWNYSLANTRDPYRLLEAHVFRRLSIAEDVAELKLSRREGDGTSSLGDIEWFHVQKHAHNWARRNGGIKVTIVGG